MISNEEYYVFENWFLSYNICRGDHIVPNFEEIWPSKKGGKKGRPMRGMEYYLDAMENGPQLSGKSNKKLFYIQYNFNKFYFVLEDY